MKRIKTMNDPGQTSNGRCLPRLSGDLYKRFFQNLSLTCNVTKSAASIGVSRQHVHHLRRNNKQFAKDWDDAIERATDTLEAEARRRALEGFARPIYYQGKKVGDEILYSDQLMVTLLRAHRPDKFRESGFDLPPGSEIVIAMRRADEVKTDEVIDITPTPDTPDKITE
ncbi:MAG: hypothetical protein Q7J67_00600 [bacterium]|nr:hypothetical protein [bacterium]